MRRALLLLLLAWSGHGCAYLEPKSAVVVDRAWGIAGAPTEAEAAELAATIEATLAHYRARPGFEERPLRAHLVHSNPRENFGGLTVEPAFGRPWIVASSASSDVRRTIAHEMAHHYFDRHFDRLPIVLEEGACELLSSELYPDESRQELVLLAVISYLDELVIRIRGAQAKDTLSWLTKEVPSIEELLLQDRGKYMHDELRTLKNTYGVGIMLAQEIGFEGIIELARRAEAEGLPQAEPQWVLEAAGLWPMTQWKLSQAFARTLGTPMRSPRQTLTITLSDP